MATSRCSKKIKRCATCKYWQGTRKVVTGGNVEYDSIKGAVCSKLGVTRMAGNICKDWNNDF